MRKKNWAKRDSISPRRKFHYTQEIVDRLFNQLLKLTNYSGSSYVLVEVLNEIDDIRLNQLFIYDLGKFLAEYNYWFKDIDKVPQKYVKTLCDVFYYGPTRYNMEDTDMKFFKYSVNYAKKRKYTKYTKFLAQTATAAIRNKRLEVCADGQQISKNKRLKRDDFEITLKLDSKEN
jgi:hypothetical protein